MKKNILSLAVAASATGIASLASAQMYINTEHTGEALIFPFYSAQNGNDTYISIANTTAQTKAVKVRIIEGEDSQETLDFNLYMSPQDHFSFAITADGDGALLRTGDSSCTVPAITGDVPFTDLLWVEDDDDGNPLVGTAEGREQVGYIEVIEMGQIDNDSATGLDILHAQTGATKGQPADCDAVVDLWSVTVDDDGNAVPGDWYTEAGAAEAGEGGNAALVSQGVTDFEAAVWNGGGLYGVATVINVAEGTAFGYDAVAIEGLVAAGSASSVLHYPPGDTRPDLADDALADTAIVSIDGTQTTYTNDALGAGNVNPVSALFMTSSISNDYVIDDDINGLTDWIVTMPTKGLHLGVAYTQPFSNDLDGSVSGDSVLTDAQVAQGCQAVSMVGYDREEQVQAEGEADPDSPVAPPFSPSTRPEEEDGVDPTDWLLCGEANVVHFGASSATNTSNASDAGFTLASAQAFVTGWAAGWAELDLTEAGLGNDVDQARVLPGTLTGNADLAAGSELAGLPVTGFAVVEYTNGTDAGAVRNYASAWEHKTNAAGS